MSLISSALSYAGSVSLSFLFEPVKAVAQGIRAFTWPCRGRCTRKIHPDEVRSKIPQEELVPDSVARKINRFITELGLNHQNFVLRKLENSSAASIDKDANGIFRLSLHAKLIDEIKTELSAERKFIIAHEMGHAIAGDYGGGTVTLHGISSIARIAIYTAAVMISPIGLAGSHILGCATSRLVGFGLKYAMHRRVEFRADVFAARRSQELCRGGIVFFENQINANLTIVQPIIQLEVTRLEKKLKLPKCMSRVTTIIYSLYHFNSVYSKEGNDVADLEHPPLTERLANLKRIYQKEYVNRLPAMVVQNDRQ